MVTDPSEEMRSVIVAAPPLPPGYTSCTSAPPREKQQINVAMHLFFFPFFLPLPSFLSNSLLWSPAHLFLSSFHFASCHNGVFAWLELLFSKGRDSRTTVPKVTTRWRAQTDQLLSALALGSPPPEGSPIHLPFRPFFSPVHRLLHQALCSPEIPDFLRYEKWRPLPPPQQCLAQHLRST